MYRASFTAINDWAYFDRLLSFQWVAKKDTTKLYCWALINSNQCKGAGVIYKWWKLRRRDYVLIKEK